MSEPRRVNQHSIGKSWGRVAWLPDGTALSYWSRRNGSDAIVIHRLGSGEEREVLSHEILGWPGYMGWFPDGDLMTYEVNGENRIFRKVDSRTTEAHETWTVSNPPLDPNRGGPGSSDSPDLMSVFYHRKDESVPCEGNVCTWVMFARDLRTNQERELFRVNAAAVGNPWPSRDGRDFVFVARTSDGFSVMLTPASGGTPRELYRSNDRLPLNYVEWTRDGRHVLVSSNGAGRQAIWSVPRDGGSPASSPLRINVGTRPVVSMDGKQIAFGGNVPVPREVWVVTGLLPTTNPAPAQ